VFAGRRARAALLVVVAMVGFGAAFVAVGPSGAALTATTVPNPDPPPVPPPPPAPVPPPPPPPPPAYVPPPPPPPPAYVPPPPPPPPAYVLPRRHHRAKSKAHAVRHKTVAKKRHRLQLAPPDTNATPRAPTAAAVSAAHASGVATAQTSSRSLSPLLVAAGVGLALLLLTLAFVRASPLGPRLGAVVDARRESLILGAAVCVVGIALGLLLAMIGL
jgi:outer membrane biosynthesis protein TonB